MTAQPDPLKLQSPDYPDQIDRDLPTSREVPFNFAEDQDLFVLLQIPRLNSDDEWIRETIRADDKLRPFVHSPTNSCYRNAALVALMNLPPFINLLQKVSKTPHDHNKILPPLANLAVELRNPSPGQNRSATLMRLMELFWNQLRQPAVQSDPDIKPVDGWGHGGDRTAMDDPSNFIFYLFDRIASGDLSQDQVDPISGISMIDMFKRLFQTNLIARTPFRCRCGNLKRRQRVLRKGYTMDVNLQVSRRLEELIAESFWDVIRGPNTPLCSVCGAAASTKSEFYKFAYLPEVLIFSTSYVRDDGTGLPGSAWTNVPEARLTYPETLDMSNLRDDPDGRDADQNCLYRLQSIVVAPNQGTPMWVRRRSSFSGVHFKTFVRRDETVWTLLDDISETSSQVDISKIRMDTFRPRLLMYVRVHPSEVEVQGRGQKDKDTSSNDVDMFKNSTVEMGQPGFLDEDMGVFTEDEEFGDESAEDSPPEPQNGPPALNPTGVEGDKTTAPANQTSTASRAEVETQAEKQTQILPLKSTTTPPADAPLGPLEGDPKHYSLSKAFPPGRLMRIIHAAGIRREMSGRGLRRFLGGARQMNRARIATRLAMSTTAVPRQAM